MATTEPARRIRIVVFAVDPGAEAFREDTFTLTAGPSGARILLRHPVTPGTALVIFNVENGRQAEFLVQGTTAPNEVTIVSSDSTMDVWQPIEAELWQSMEKALRPESEVTEAEEIARRAEERLVAHAAAMEAAQHEAQKAALQASRLMKLEVEELARRAEMARSQAEEWARRAEEACSRASAAAREMDTLRDAKMAAAVTCQAAQRAAQENAAQRAAPPPAARPVAPAPATPPAAKSAPLAPAPLAPAPPILHPPDLFRTGPVSWEDARISRRVQVKTRARIRRDDGAEIVYPLDVSRRGLRFESRASYPLNSVVWVAMHYREDDVDLMETPSRVVRVSPGEDGHAHSYGLKFEN